MRRKSRADGGHRPIARLLCQKLERRRDPDRVSSCRRSIPPGSSFITDRMARTRNKVILGVTVIAPDGAVGATYEFPRHESVSIGRSTTSDVCLKDYGSRVSRHHAVVLFDGIRWEYCNLGINGSFEDGRQVETADLTSGSTIRLGRTGPVLQFALTPVTEELTGEITEWIHRARTGDEEAARQLWQAWAKQLVDVARRSLASASRRVQDEEDVAQMAFRSFLQGLVAGRFPDLDEREQMNRLLITITARKAAQLIDQEGRLKRGGGEVRGESGLLESSRDDSTLQKGFDSLPLDQPPPELASDVADETRHLLESLPDELARQVVTLKMEGWSHDDIARHLNVTVRTIERRVKAIRAAWEQLLDESSVG